MKKRILILFIIFSLMLCIENVFAEKIIREYDANDSVALPFVIQYDTELKKYELGVALHGYNNKSNLTHNGSEYMLGTYKYNGKPSTSYSYSLYLNETDSVIELKANESLKIYYCVSSEYGGGNYTNGTKYVFIFYDKLQYEKNKENLKYPTASGKEKVAKIEECVEISSNEVKDDTSGVEEVSGCETYNSMMDDIKTNYKKYANNSDVSALNVANEEVVKIKNICNSIMQYSDYGESCMTLCLNLNEDIKDAKESYGIGNSSNNTECGFSKRLMAWISNILRWIKYILPVIVIVMGILDFIKAIAADKDDEMKKAQGKFIKRLIAAALVFIIPLILEFVLDKMGFGYDSCGLF